MLLNKHCYLMCHTTVSDICHAFSGDFSVMQLYMSEVLHAKCGFGTRCSHL